MLLRACALYEFDQGHAAAEACLNIRSTNGSDSISDLNCPNLEDIFHCSLRTISNALNEIGKIKMLGKWVFHKLSKKPNSKTVTLLSSLRQRKMFILDLVINK